MNIKFVRAVAALAVLFFALFLSNIAVATNLKIVPSKTTVMPGEDFYFDVIVEDVPSEGLATVQFKLNVSVDKGQTAGVSELAAAAISNISVVTPLLAGGSTEARSGLGDFFLNNSTENVLFIDNGLLQNGSSMYTYAHTNGAVSGSGGGSIARFAARVGSDAATTKIIISVEDIALLNGSVEFAVDSNEAATISVGCIVLVPDLTGMAYSDALSLLQNNNLTVGTVYEVGNLTDVRPQGVVLEQSYAAGTKLTCEAAVNLAVNYAPDEVGFVVGVDKLNDESGTVVLTWEPSSATDVAGYKIYFDGNLIKVVSAETTSTEVTGLPNDIVSSLVITAYDVYGNENTGAGVQVLAADDVVPTLTVSGVSDGLYNAMVSAIYSAEGGSVSATLNGLDYIAGTPITADGAYTLIVMAMDAAGNMANQTYAFTIDTAAPVVIVNGVDDGMFYNTSLIPSYGSDGGTISATLNGADYTSGTPIIEDGNYKLVVTAMDAAGNVTAQTITFAVDTAAPVSSYAIGAPNYTSAGEVFVNGATFIGLTADDVGTVGSGVRMVEYKFDDSGEIFRFIVSVSLENLADGPHALYFRAVDEAGNIEAWQSVGIVIDNTAPKASLEAGSPKYVSNAMYVLSSTQFSLSASDTGAGLSALRYAVDGSGWQDYGSAFAIAGEGEHVIKYYAIDNLGNVGSENLFTVIVDNIAPSVSMTVNGAVYENENAVQYMSYGSTVLVSSLDSLSGVAGVEYKIDDGAWLQYEPFTIGIEGQHTILIRSYDNLGNVSSVYGDVVYVDATSPELSISIGDPKYQGPENFYVTSDAIFTINAFDTESGISQVVYRVDSGAWLPYIPFKLAGDGAHVVEYKGVDNVGNAGAIQALHVFVDNVSPDTSFVRGENSYMTSQQEIFISPLSLLSLNSVDSGAGVAAIRYRVDGGEWKNYEPFSAENAGVHIIEYAAIDYLGNVEVVETVKVVTDDAPPVTALYLGSPNYETSGVMYISDSTVVELRATDSFSGKAKTYYKVDGGEWVDYAPFVIETEGVHTIAYKSVDNVGNGEDVKIYTVIVDASSPMTIIGASEPKYRNGDMFYVTSNTAIVVNAIDSMSGIANIYYKVDDGAWEYFTPFKLAGEGEHMVYFKSIDNVNNGDIVKAVKFIVDDTPPTVAVETGTPSFVYDDVEFVSSSTDFTIQGNDLASGVGAYEYRIDGGAWMTSQNFTVSGEGARVVECRVKDNVGNISIVIAKAFLVDNSSPVTEVNTTEPNYRSGGDIFVTAQTLVTLSSRDALSGVSSVLVSVDGGTWDSYMGQEIVLQAEGSHMLSYLAADNLGNKEGVKTTNIITDNSAPISAVDYGNSAYDYNGGKLVSAASEAVISSDDALSGTYKTYYSLDNGNMWSEYMSAIGLDGIGAGPHTLLFYSVDNLGNVELAKSANFVAVNTNIDVKVANLPRVLVWVSDPANGTSSVPYTLDDLKRFIQSALGVSDVYYVIVTDKESFKVAFRSGIYNVAAIIAQDTPFDAVFLRELREAIYGGVGLIVSGWGNSVKPIMEEALGVSFAGSQSMDISKRAVYFHQGPLSSPGGYVVAEGRMLNITATGGTVAAVNAGDYVCNGIRSITLNYARAFAVGDNVVVSVTTGSKGNGIYVDDERITIGALPVGSFNNSQGSIYGDVSIEAITGNTVTLSVNPYVSATYLEPVYYVEVKVFGNGNSPSTTGKVAINSTCAANLFSGMSVNPYVVASINADYTMPTAAGMATVSPVAVLGEYGSGKTVFFAFDIAESAMYGYTPEYAKVFNNAAKYVAPVDTELKAAATYLLETDVSIGNVESYNVRAMEVLGEGLQYVPLFDLVYPALTFDYTLNNGVLGTYRYFVRMPYSTGDYVKTTNLYIDTNGIYNLFDSRPEGIVISDDMSSVRYKIVQWIEANMALHPEAQDALVDIMAQTLELGNMVLTSKVDAEIAIRHTVQIVHGVGQLTIDTVDARKLYGEYIRILGVRYSELP